ncbi:MAG: tRNA (adenosine(37)-N6)-threonylcarbamoyltransferase complex ATPase subunit type 1 TsaE [Chloroherpetonaceae bacterium]|nr:tRNA (adenosine(37)-N6)-threonylcarbamoyltransferase complex ATPase subunit type 1 TsaE [Chloroherpetonaceae bacterium]
MTKEILSRSDEETREFARQFATTLQRGDIVALIGELGAGKTQFIRGIADVFNVETEVTSPTFALLNIYEGHVHGKPVKLYHFDWYRLQDEEELYHIGYEDYLYGEGLCMIEWADRFPSKVPKHARRITIEHAGETERRIVIEGGLPIARADTFWR